MSESRAIPKDANDTARDAIASGATPEQVKEAVRMRAAHSQSVTMKQVCAPTHTSRADNPNLPASDEAAEILSLGELSDRSPELRPVLIDGLLRRGETMNIIAPSKEGKSWLAILLAICVALGRPWLGLFKTLAGKVLIIDNELHGATLAHRPRVVCKGLKVDFKEIAGLIHVMPLRGNLKDIHTLEPSLRPVKFGKYALIIMDALYRFIPEGKDENSNANMSALYNHIDAYALRTNAAICLVHHTTKGSQSGRGITDTGAGAGAISRAADTHLVLRPHEEPHVCVLEARCRTFQTPDPVCVEWKYPIWVRRCDLDPTRLAGRKKKNDEAEGAPPKVEWDSTRFVETFLSPEPKTKAQLYAAAEPRGLKSCRVDNLLETAVGGEKAFRWITGPHSPHAFATVPQLAPEPPSPAQKPPERKSKSPQKQGGRGVKTPPVPPTGVKPVGLREAGSTRLRPDSRRACGVQVGAG